MPKRAAAVSRVEAGEPISAVAREAGVTYQAVYRWLCSKKQPDGIYYTQEDGCMDRHENVEDLKLEVKALREEVEYLTAKAAYLDALLELSGIPAGKFKKKKMRGHPQSGRRRRWKRKDAVRHSRCLPQELLPSSQGRVMLG